MPISRFVDAHIHLWDLKQLRYPWLTSPFSNDGPNGSVESIARDYGVADYLRDAAGYPVMKTVHIDAGAHPNDALSETRWLQSLADQGGFPHAIVAFAPLNDPNVETLLAAHAESPNVRGIRHIINWHPDPRRAYTPHDLLEDDAFAAGYARLAKYGLAFDLQIYPNQMNAAYLVGKANPDVPVSLNHMGMPVDTDLTQWREGLDLLARLPHVAVKISGMGFVNRNWTLDGMRPLVLEVIDRFGPDRCAFASDFPTDRLFNSYGRQLDFFDAVTQDFSASERDALFAGTAERIYRI